MDLRKSLMKTPMLPLAAAVLAAVSLAACATPANDGNKVDRAVEATTDAAGDVADTIADGAGAVRDEVAGSATWARIEGNWKQFTGAAKERWGELTDDDMDQVDGNYDQLVGKVQEGYGITRTEAQDQVNEWAGDQ